MPRRANNEGSIYKRESDGRWCGSLSLSNGRRKVVYGRTRSEVALKMRDLHRQQDAGLRLTSGKGLTVAQYLEHWTAETLPSKMRAGQLAASTLDSYRTQVRLHITPALGHLQLRELTVPAVRAWLDAKLHQPSRGDKPLSPRTVVYLHAVLRSALSDAQRDDLVDRNVATSVVPPRSRRAPVKPLSEAEARELIAAARGTRQEVLWLVLLTLGLRRGEALALRWQDLDLVAGTVTVRRSLQRVRRDVSAEGGRRGELVETDLKTEGSAATLALPLVLTSALNDHRARQQVERRTAAAWQDDGLVFTTRVGSALEPRNVSRTWAALLAGAGIRQIRLHDLRHSAASFMLAQGVDMKVVQTTLRHSRMSTTADLYTHVLEDVQRDSASRMDRFVRSLEPPP